jgi:hypothetical protein
MWQESLKLVRRFIELEFALKRSTEGLKEAG